MTASTAGGIVHSFVDGEYVTPTAEDVLFDRVDPATGAITTRVHEADAEIVDRAVHAARSALAGSWTSWTTQQRADLLRRAASAIENRADEFVAAEVADTGKPMSQARSIDVARAISNFRAFADVTASAGQTSFLTELPDGRKALNYALRKPLGVVAVIVPWNLPLLLLTWKVAPALACGNTVVVKPSEYTPSTATLLAEILRDVGTPPGVYNVVHGFGGGSAGEFLTTHPGVDGVTFTGSTATGARVMESGAKRIRPVSFELGGKNAAIVFADTDLDATLDGLERSIFSNTGQVCLCTERVYVQRPIFESVVNGLAARAQKLRLGDPHCAETTTGPLISATHRRKVLEYFELAERAGAEVVTGGAVPVHGNALDGGFWVEPTLWTGLSHDSRPMREEIFGPVAGLIPFDTEAEAIQLANDTDYGLAAAVWTTDLSRGHRVAQAMSVGISWINTWFLRDLRSPFGGMKLSGIGREGGEDSLHFYTERTNVCALL